MTVTIIDTSRLSIIECIAALSVIASFFSPIYFDTTAVVPAPRLVPMQTIRYSRGITKPIAASWSTPRPAIQTESMIL